jgi:3'(2'), 5'-bisphosphate nucleotidase
LQPLLKELMQSVRTIAAEASYRILDIYIREDVQISTKADDSPLTQADMAAHHHILERLQALTPDIPVLSEENAEAIAPGERLAWSRYWLVDPLDGTKEFLAQNGEFTVNIALIDHHEPVLGVVAVPAKKISYFAAVGVGAFKAGPDEVPHPIQCRHLEDSEEQPPVVVTSRRSGTEGIESFLEQLGNYELTAIGSSIKMCLIAEGKADLYPRLGPTSEWDTAAAQCVVTCAGGSIISLEDGEPLRYGMKESLLNPHFLAAGDPRALDRLQLTSKP